ncbi:MAG TPA: MarR family transcriptional regulator [Bauldia sp.]|nr:MarR family transcriptional regulator [Bauldia sp.]
MSQANLRPPLDAETKVAESLVSHKAELRLWLRLFTCTTLIEVEVRKRLRTQFGETLPRFDLMAQLERVEDGMTLGEISKRMMVSAGNVTSLVERLVQNGHLERRTDPKDRRSQRIRLTAAGRAHFGRMAASHEEWVAELLADLKPKEIAAALAELEKVKHSVRRALRGGRQ